ncbi:alpha/beta hydrolase [Flagellimonas sp. HMM57]|uniref:alpha/beta fold hydrolase n=1 Tax=unclassified Flagellimonas TaxID=2644544 RepID=UPI0013D8657D|nr:MULTISPECIES: alpha/beta hydrolase [unclassified Flagellimonas]UII75879.1 alpha/beta hydrolase [Flagellimonas sp. HMM57]
MNKMTIFKTVTADLNEVRITYTISGETNNETILFVHGLGANALQFSEQHAYFHKKYKVISINLRGHGNSCIVHEFDSPEPTLQKMAKDIIGLLYRLAIRHVHFVGNSMGGNVGYEVLRLAPERIKSFTTFGTTAHMKTSKFMLGLLLLSYKVLPLRYIAFLSKSAGQTAASKERIEKMLMQSNKKTIMTLVPHLANFDYLDIVEETTVPVTILKGKLDKEINKVLGSTLTRFKKRGNFSMIVIRNAGHFANLDNPATFNAILENFILKINTR